MYTSFNVIISFVQTYVYIVICDLCVTQNYLKNHLLSIPIINWTITTLYCLFLINFFSVISSKRKKRKLGGGEGGIKKMYTTQKYKSVHELKVAKWTRSHTHTHFINLVDNEFFFLLLLLLSLAGDARCCSLFVHISHEFY